MKKPLASFVTTLMGLSIFIATSTFSTPAQSQSVYARANWLTTIQASLFNDVKRQFKTRYDGSTWAKACRDPGYAQRLGLDTKELSTFVFDRINGREDIAKIKPLEKWMLVHAVVGMAKSYLEGANAFVRATGNECKLVLKGLRREFP